MTAISPNGRITEGCAGIYTEKQVDAWRRVTDFVHSASSARIAIQLGHAGRKGAIRKPWEGKNEPLESPWELLSASPLPYSNRLATPREVTQKDMSGLTELFVAATQNAERAGFDMIELQAHHGFLLASFISPLTNQRRDEYGGSLENRLRFPLEVFNAMRKAWPADKPMSVRISASDWADSGISLREASAVARAFRDAGADIINVSTGNTVEHQQARTGRMWQSTFSEYIRNTSGIPTITTGGIQDIDQVNTLLLNGRADLVALGRPLLLDPSFVRQAQAYEAFEDEDIPLQYQQGKSHLFPLKSAERKYLEDTGKLLKPESHKTRK